MYAKVIDATKQQEVQSYVILFYFYTATIIKTSQVFIKVWYFSFFWFS
jgi:hypothetical protein